MNPNRAAFLSLLVGVFSVLTVGSFITTRYLIVDCPRPCAWCEPEERAEYDCVVRLSFCMILLSLIATILCLAGLITEVKT